MQVIASGGPYPASRVEFSSSNGSVCSVGAVSGLLTGAVTGNSTVTAKAVMHLRHRHLVLHSAVSAPQRIRNCCFLVLVQFSEQLWLCNG